MGTVINVTNSVELLSALASASGGETIFLAAGNYGNLELSETYDAFVKFASEVTIKSADPNDPAVFDTVSLRGVENLTFDSVKLDYTFSSGDPDFISPFKIEANSSNITITNSIFDGDIASGVSQIVDGFGTGNGLFVRDSSNINITNNEFYDWKRAGVFNNVEDLVVSGNDVHSIRSDGFDFAEVNRVLIEKNHLHDFVEAPLSDDHKDMIQFWTTSTTSPSTDITIRENILNSGEGSWTQSIFMRNEVVDLGQAGSDMFYRNITIEDNVIHNAHAHGITVGETDGLIIQNNTMLFNEESWNEGLVSVPAINVSRPSINVSVIDNIIPREINGVSVEWIVGNNLVVQIVDPTGANFVGDLFVNGLAGSASTLADLMAVNGGIIEQLGIGSFLTLFDINPTTPVGYVVDDSGSELNLSTLTFDASNVFGQDGKLDLTGAQIVWDFGNGNEGQGVTTVHNYAHAGSYNVKAIVTLADGRIVNLQKTVDVQTPVALKANFDNGPDDLSDLVNAVTIGSGVTFEQSADGDAARLNNSAVTYARSEEMRDNSEYTVLFDLKKDTGNLAATGTAIYYSGSIVVNVQANGLDVTMITDKGVKTINSGNLGINDANWHKIAITFSGIEGVAKLFVDGTLVGQADGLAGAIQTGSAYHDFHVGSPFGESFSGLIDNVGFLRGAIAAKDANAGLAALTSGSGQGSSDGEPTTTPTASPTTEPTTTPTTEPTTTPTTEPTSDAGGSPSKGSGRAKFDNHDPIKGTKNKDKLDGTQGSDLMLGYDGTDSLDGKAGDDALIGGGGGDAILGGSGDDFLDGEGGGDVLKGQGGDDTIIGGSDQDRLVGGAGNDDLSGDNGSDVLIGNYGNDTIYGGKKADLLFGGAGNDTLYGGRGGDELTGHQGDDTLYGGKGDDILKGGGGNDVLVGGYGNDSLYGGAGDDVFVYGSETNSSDRIYDFVAGEDTITLRGLSSITIGRVLDTASQVGNDTVLSFDALGGNEVTLIGISKDDLTDANFSLAS